VTSGRHRHPERGVDTSQETDVGGPSAITVPQSTGTNGSSSAPSFYRHSRPASRSPMGRGHGRRGRHLSGDGRPLRGRAQVNEHPPGTGLVVVGKCRDAAKIDRNRRATLTRIRRVARVCQSWLQTPAERSVSVVNYEIGVIRRAAHGLCSCPAEWNCSPTTLRTAPQGPSCASRSSFFRPTSAVSEHIWA
jgi:hypothetical protein